jgi:proline iminopeptidase
MYYKMMGSGIPLLILHGGPGLDHSYFLPQFAELAKDYKLIFIDQRANGRTEAPDSTKMNLSFFIEDIESVRKEFALGKLNLLGHSWGALIAMFYAVRYPENLNLLILMNPVSASSQGRDTANKLLQSRITKQDSIDRAEVMRSEGFRSRTPEAISKLFRIAFRPSFYNKTLVDSITLTFQPDYAKKSSTLRHMRGLLVYDIQQELSRIQCPTLILHGADDAIPLLTSRELQKQIGGSQLVVLYNCGHFPYIDAPQEFFKSVRLFMNSVPH